MNGFIGIVLLSIILTLLIGVVANLIFNSG